MHLPSIPLALALLGPTAALAACTNATLSSILAAHPHATLTRLEAVPANGTFGEGNFTYAAGLPALCAVSVNVRSSANSSYNFGLFLPEAWDGRFAMTGNGGLGGFVNWFVCLVSFFFARERCKWKTTNKLFCKFFAGSTWLS